MEQLKSMKDQLTTQVHAQLANIEKADYHELGAAIDMIKDIAETEYYCSVVKAMEEKQQEKEVERYYYTERYMPISYQRTFDRDMDRGYGRMYYDGGNSGGGGGSNSSSGGQSSGGSGYSGGGSSYSERGGGRNYQENPRNMGGNDQRGYYEMPYMLPSSPLMMRDPREGRSASRRKMYMESKEMHQPKDKQMHELDSYMQELTGDITDMIRDASPEERQLLQQKLSGLVTKIDQVK